MAPAKKTSVKSDPGRTAPRQPSALRPESSVRWRRRKDARPQEILDAALFTFAQKGFAAARMEDIGERAGVSKGTIYLYFESKEAVFKALLHETIAKRFSLLSDLARDHHGPVAPLLAEILRQLGQFIATSDLVVLPKMVIAEAGNFPDLARIYREEVAERGLKLFGGLLRTGMERGEFRKFPVQHAVRLCIAPLLLAAIWRTTFAPINAEPYDYARMIDAHIQTLLRGLRPDGQTR